METVTNCLRLFGNRRIQILQQYIDVQTMRIGSLSQGFILCPHTSHTAEMMFLQHFHRIRMHAHHFKKSHIRSYFISHGGIFSFNIFS